MEYRFSSVLDMTPEEADSQNGILNLLGRHIQTFGIANGLKISQSRMPKEIEKEIENAVLEIIAKEIKKLKIESEEI